MKLDFAYEYSTERERWEVILYMKTEESFKYTCFFIKNWEPDQIFGSFKAIIRALEGELNK